MTIERLSGAKASSLKVNVNLKLEKKQDAAVPDSTAAATAADSSCRKPRLSSILSANELDSIMMEISDSGYLNPDSASYPSPFTAGMFDTFKFDVPVCVEEEVDSTEEVPTDDLSFFPNTYTTHGGKYVTDSAGNVLKDDQSVFLNGEFQTEEQKQEGENSERKLYTDIVHSTVISAFEEQEQLTQASGKDFHLAERRRVSNVEANRNTDTSSRTGKSCNLAQQPQQTYVTFLDSSTERIRRCCEELGISIDAEAWTREDVDRWCSWVLRLFSLQGSISLQVDGKQLCALSKQDFENRLPVAGGYIYTELELWKNVYFLMAAGLNKSIQFPSSNSQPLYITSSAPAAAEVSRNNVALTTLTSTSALSSSSCVEAPIPLCVSSSEYSDIPSAACSTDFASVIMTSHESNHRVLPSSSTVSQANSYVTDQPLSTLDEKAIAVVTEEQLNCPTSVNDIFTSVMFCPFSSAQSHYSTPTGPVTSSAGSVTQRPTSLPIPHFVLQQRAATPTSLIPSESVGAEALAETTTFLSGSLDPILPLFASGLDANSPGFGQTGSNYNNSGSNNFLSYGQLNSSYNQHSSSSSSFGLTGGNSNSSMTPIFLENTSSSLCHDIIDSGSAGCSPYNSSYSSSSYSYSSDSVEDTMDADNYVSSGNGTLTYGRQSNHLWQFLKELLHQPTTYKNCIRWIEQEKGIFKIEDSGRVAKLWGQRKNRPAMNYDKLSRSIRQYYKKGIIKKTSHSKRLVYQFCV